MASRLANTEDSISHLDSKTPVLDVGSYERLLFMEASLDALSDSSPSMAERRWSAVQSLKRPSIPIRGSRQARVAFRCSSPAADHRELDGRDPRALREHVYFSAEDRRRATVGACQEEFRVGTSLLAIHHCWRRCWDVCNPS